MWNESITIESEEFAHCIDENGSEIEFVFSDMDSILAGSSATVCSFLGITFNLVTILALLNHTPLRKHVTTPFVISLAFSDFLFSFAVLPLMAIRFFARDWIVGSETGFLCQLFPMLFYGNTAATLFNILAVTINRWCMIYFPEKSDSIYTRRNSKLIIAACWILPVLIMTPSLTQAWSKHELDCKTRSCTIVEQSEDSNVMPFKKFLIGFGVTFPMLVLVLANLMIYFKVRQMSRLWDQQMRNSQVPNSLKDKEKQLTKMMAIIFLIFLMTYIPSALVKQLDEEYSLPTTHVLCYIINWLAVIMNPAIYVATQERYRQAILLLYARVRFFRNGRKYQQELNNVGILLRKSQIRSSTIS